MAGFAFADSEVVEVRLQLGKSLKFSQLTDTDINSKTVRDAACDYVVETVTKGITAESLAE